MVAQHLFPPTATSEQTLDAVWRSTADRVSVRSAVLLIVLGLGGVMVRAITGRFAVLASLGILATAFACYAMIPRPRPADRGWISRGTRALAGLMTIAAALAGLATGLLVLAAVFGGSIEVMRR
jgi:hypothetical protein